MKRYLVNIFKVPIRFIIAMWAGVFFGLYAGLHCYIGGIRVLQDEEGKLVFVFSSKDKTVSQLDAVEATPEGIKDIPKNIRERLDRVKLVKKEEV